MKKEIKDLQQIVNRLKTQPIAAEKSELQEAATLFMEGFNQINSILKDYELANEIEVEELDNLEMEIKKDLQERYENVYL